MKWRNQEKIKKKLEKIKENKIECDGEKKWCRREKNKIREKIKRNLYTM